ncbi:hypothetical protein M3J09_004995 [Ascochyta lentis]
MHLTRKILKSNKRLCAGARRMEGFIADTRYNESVAGFLEIGQWIEWYWKLPTSSTKMISVCSQPSSGQNAIAFLVTYRWRSGDAEREITNPGSDAREIRYQDRPTPSG